jgi:hypothetical protein
MKPAYCKMCRMFLFCLDAGATNRMPQDDPTGAKYSIALYLD